MLNHFLKYWQNESSHNSRNIILTLIKIDESWMIKFHQNHSEIYLMLLLSNKDDRRKIRKKIVFNLQYKIIILVFPEKFQRWSFEKLRFFIEKLMWVIGGILHREIYPKMYRLKMRIFKFSIIWFGRLESIFSRLSTDTNFW